MSTSSLKATAALVRSVGGPFTVESVDVAMPRDHEVRVRMVASGMCHTDLVVRDGFPVPLPIILGHEGSGVVESIGAKVTRLSPGDHVVLSFNSCRACANCSDHQPAYCHHFMAHNFLGARPQDGTTAISQDGHPVAANFFGQSSFSSIAVAHEVNAVKVDKSLPLELLGPLGCGIQTGAGAAVNSIGLREGESLAIFGGGAVGLSALLGARAIDAGMVIVVEPNPSRAELARQLGASHVINPKETEDVLARIRALSGGGVTHALDTTGIPAVIAVAIETMLPRGCLGLIGVPPPEATQPGNMLSMLLRGVSVKYIIEGDADPQEFIPRMIGWYRSGRFPFDRLIKTFRFEDINQAALASETGSAIKPVLLF